MSWQDDLTPKENVGGVESSWEDSTPREDEGPGGVETGGRTDGGGGERTKTYPPPEIPGSAQTMVETARLDKAR